MTLPGSRHAHANFGKFIDKAFWVMLIFIAKSVAGKVDSINENMEALNKNMAAVTTEISDHDRRMNSLDSRVERIEKLQLLQAENDPGPRTPERKKR